MMLSFTKMHGLGNDFIVFNAIDQSVELTRDQYRQLADRRLGIGCDQILLVESARDQDTDFYYRIFNADGSEVEQCGNGARCFARFVRDQGLTAKTEIHVGTASGAICLQVEADDQIKVNMGAPRFAPADLPFQAEQQATAYQLEIAGTPNQLVEISALSMGNPHAVLLVDDVSEAPVETLGPAIQQHSRFPKGVNVGFMQILNRQQIRLRVFERGTGETLACGTGACAAVVAGQIRGLLDEMVQVQLPGGELMISWQAQATQSEQPVWMTGPATRVFDGEIDL